MKKHINFYSFGGEERMRKERHSDFLRNWEHNFKLCTEIFKTGSSSKQNNRVLQQIDRCIVHDLRENV